MMFEKKILHKIFSRISHGAVAINYWDGTKQIYGNGQPYFTLTLTSPKVVRAMLRNMSLGFGEAYMDARILLDGDLGGPARLAAENRQAFSAWKRTSNLGRTHRNTRSRQKSFVAHHYDLGNDFYRLWLDESMTYSCAYFRSKRDSLEDAQHQKVDYLLKKLQLKPGHRLLDIGSGWGTLLLKAAREYSVNGLGITLSEEQFRYATEAARKAGLADKVEFRLCNFQDLSEEDQMFDRIISVGMFEHVGKDNLKSYYKAVHDMLRPGGLTVLHTITAETEHSAEPWIDRYIFPGGYLPTVREIVSALPEHNFRLLDYENLRLHYAMTLDEWQKRFRKRRDQVVKLYNERFYRMWDLWLASSSASFRYGEISLSQFVLSKGINNELPLTREFLYK